MNGLRRMAGRIGGEALGALAACVLVAAAGAGAAAEQEYELYLAELESPGAQYIVTSNHFRHDVGCTSRGCIIMGPTSDQDACKAWSKSYNKIDPYDHSNCVEASDYERIRY